MLPYLPCTTVTLQWRLVVMHAISYTHWLFNWHNDIAVYKTTGCIAEQFYATFEQTRVRAKKGVECFVW